MSCISTDEVRFSGFVSRAHYQKKTLDGSFFDSYSLFRGAVIFDGEGIMDVQKVGLHTMMGKMAEEMQEEEPDSPLKVKLSKLADQISKFGYIGAIVIAVMYFVYFIIMAGGSMQCHLRL